MWEHRVLTALVKFIRSVVTETVWACGLQEPKDETDNLHQRQEGWVCERLVWGDFVAVPCPDRLPKDGDIEHARLEEQFQLLIARSDVQSAQL